MVKLPITACLITLNEESNLKRLLPELSEHVRQIIVVDSFSTDNTIGVLKEFNVCYEQRVFDGFGSQWNYLLGLRQIESAWIMKIDPDESLTPTLWKEIELAVLSEENIAFSWRRILFLGGSETPAYSWVVRLWRNNMGVKFSTVKVNEHPLIKSQDIKKLKGFMLHYDTDIQTWISKQSHYAFLEAEMRLLKSPLSIEPNILGSQLERKMFLKSISRRLPFKSIFLACYYFILFYRGSNFKSLILWIKTRIVVYWLRELYYFELLQNEGEE